MHCSVHDRLLGRFGTRDFFGDTPLAGDEYPVREMQRQLRRNHHHRKPSVGDAVDELVDFGNSADIDAAGRFVKDDELLFSPISWKTNDPRTIWRATEASARSGSPALGVYRRALRVGALQTMSAVRVGTVEGEIVPCAFEHQRIGPQGGQALLDPGEQEPSPGYPQPGQSVPGMNYCGPPTRR